jgi:hypothetical protein
MMSRALVMLALLAGLAAPLVSPGTAFAQGCAPTLADGFLNRCPPINEGGGHVGHRPDRLPHGDNDFSGNNGIHGTGGTLKFDNAAAHSAGMQHGGGAEGGVGGGHGK